jgi:hypothetical protein
MSCNRECCRCTPEPRKLTAVDVLAYLCLIGTSVAATIAFVLWVDI